jgi:Flp pilus assembly protein TadB
VTEYGEGMPRGRGGSVDREQAILAAGLVAIFGWGTFLVWSGPAAVVVTLGLIMLLVVLWWLFRRDSW